MFATIIFLNRYTALWAFICSYRWGPSLIDFFLSHFARLTLMPWGLAGIAHEIFTIRAHHSFFCIFLNYTLTPWLRTEFFIFWNSNFMIFHQSIELLVCIRIQKLLDFLRINLLRTVNMRALHFLDLSRRINHIVVVVWEARSTKEMATDLQICDFLDFTLHVADITVKSLLVRQFLFGCHQMKILAMLY